MAHRPKIDQRPGFEQDAIAGDPAGRRRVGLLAPSPSPGRSRWHWREWTARRGASARRRPAPGGRPRAARRHSRPRPRQRDGDIAGMVEGRVPPHPPRELLARVQAQGQGRDCGTEDIADNGHQAVGDHDRPEGRQSEDNGGRDAPERQAPGRLTPRFARVSSIAAPIGVWTASPSRPPTIVTMPTSDWLQCCRVTRKTLR